MNQDLKNLIVIMNDLSEEFDNCNDISESRIRRWDEKLLQKYGIAKVKEAALKLMNTRKFNGFPKISEIIEIIEGSNDDLEEIALEQFLVAKEAIMRYGMYQSVSFDDPIINKTINSLGSWPDFCLTDNDKWTWKQRDFINNYCIFKKRFDQKTIDDIPKYLPGMHALSSSNMRSNYKPRVNEIKTNHPVTISIKIEQDKSKSVMKRLSSQIKNVTKKKDDR